MASEQALVAFAFHAALALFSAYAGVLLLRLRPADEGRTLVAWTLILGPLSAFFGLRTLAPSALDPLWATLLIFGVGASFVLSGLFFLRFPTRVPWKSALGAWFALGVVFIVVTTLVDLYGNWTGVALAVPEWFDFGAYSWERTVWVGILLLASTLRVRALPATEQRVAVRVLVALAAITCAFLGYGVVQHANALVHGPLDDHLARYPLLTTQGRLGGYDLASTVAAFVLGGSVAALILAFSHKDRVAWALLALGAAAYLLDQVNTHDIIDIGATTLITPAVLLREASQRGALGVRKVPARLGLPVAAAGGAALLLAILALASMFAADQPLVMTLALLAGLAAGGALTYALRPRGVQLTLTRAPDAGAARMDGALAHAARLATGERIAERYQLERRLGEGGEGEAWLAHDEVIDRAVVLKSVRPSGEREARLVGAVHHPNVVQVFDVVRSGGATLLVLEFVDGGDLRSLLNRARALSRDRATDLLDGVLRALAAVHARGIVHGDLKPENVLLAADGTPKVADFGVARRSASSTIVAGAGTLAYMSPEQVRGEAASAASDLYAAGLLYREMLTGERLGAGLDELQQRALLVAARDPARASVPGDDGRVRAFLARALASEPAARFVSADEMRRALAEVR